MKCPPKMLMYRVLDMASGAVLEDSGNLEMGTSWRKCTTEGVSLGAVSDPDPHLSLFVSCLP